MDEHWAPDSLVLNRLSLTYAGRLLVERDRSGEVLTYSPLEGMAAVEHRYPAWALGPFGNVETERAMPSTPGVFALVQSGVVRYVASSRNLARTFSERRGLGEISRRDCRRATHEEACRLNRLVTAQALTGEAVDVYLWVVERARLGKRRAAALELDELAARMAADGRGAWHLPS